MMFRKKGVTEAIISENFVIFAHAQPLRRRLSFVTTRGLFP